MPKPIDQTIFAPQRHEAQTGDGWDIFVTPPAAIGPMPTAVVHLTEDQYRRYQEWRNTGGLIQNLLPDLTPDQREQLITGLLNETFQFAARELDEKNK
jgi:hypothetical protein